MIAVVVRRAGRVAVLLLAVASFVQPPPLRAQTVVCFFGDSITEGWMDAQRRPDRAFPAIVDSMFMTDGIAVDVITAGAAGETTVDALQRIDRDVLAHRPDVVVFAFGSNDYFVRGIPPRPRVPVDRFRNNCRAAFRKILGSGARIIVLPPPPVLAQRFYLLFDQAMYTPSGGVEALRSAYARALSDVASEFFDVVFVTVDAALAADSTLLGFDGVHPQPAGHVLIAQALRQPIASAIAAGRVFPEPLTHISIHPSPFRLARQDVVSLTFHAPASASYLLRIHDMAGREVRKIVSYAFTQGNHVIFWDGRDERGTPAAPGTYTLSLSSGRVIFRTQRLLVL